MALDPSALDILFAADPMTLGAPDFAKVSSELRRRHSAFRAEEAAKALAPKKPRAGRIVVDEALLNKPTAEVTLADLFGEDNK